MEGAETLSNAPQEMRSLIPSAGLMGEAMWFFGDLDSYDTTSLPLASASASALSLLHKIRHSEGYCQPVGHGRTGT